MKTLLYNILRRTEKFTKTDMVYLTRGGFWLAFGQLITAGSGVLVTILFANLFSKEDFGTYQFIMTMTAAVSAFTLTGINTAVMRAVSSGSEGALRAGLRARLRWDIAMSIICCALGSYYYVNGNSILGTSFIIVALFFPPTAAFGLTKSYFIGKRLFRENTVYGIGRRLFPAAAVIIALLLTRNLLTVVFIYFAANAISAALLYFMVVRRYKLPLAHDHDLISDSKHLSVIGIFSEVVAHLDKLLVWNILGAAPMATYTLAQLPVKHLEGLFKLLHSLTFPKITQRAFGDLQRDLPRKVRLLFVIAAALVGVYVLIAPHIFNILFPNYGASVALSQAYALILLSKPRSLYSQALIAHQQRREQYMISISTSVVRIVLLCILLPLFSLWGAVYAILGTHLYLNVITRVFFHRIKV